MHMTYKGTLSNLTAAGGITQIANGQGTGTWAYIKEHGLSSGQTRKAMKASANQTEQKPRRE